MADQILIEQVRAYLADQGLVRADPSASGAAEPPMCWLDPRDGALPPKTPDLAAVTLVQTLHVPRGELEQPWQEEPIVDVWVIATTSPRATLLQRTIRNALAGQVHVTMGDLLVERCLVWRLDQPVGADDKHYSRIQSFRFLVRMKALQGLPYTP